MIEIALQLNPDFSLSVATEEGLEKLKTYKPNQILRARLQGYRRPRSVQQNNWIHAIFKITAENSMDPEWDTPEKVKRNVKMRMQFFKNDVIVDRNKVYFELRSFAFDQMGQEEADMRYTQAKYICAKHLGISPERLEAEALEGEW